MKRKITLIVMFISTAILVGWDIYVAISPPENDTISEIIQEYAFKHPIIPFIFGVLIGHFFWPVKKIE